MYGRLYFPHLVTKWNWFSKKAGLKYHDIESADTTHDLEFSFEDNPKMAVLAEIITQAE